MKAVVLAAATDQSRDSGSMAYVANMMKRIYLNVCNKKFKTKHC